VREGDVKIPITSDTSKKGNNEYLWISSKVHPANAEKCWGYLCHEYECGWFIMATKEGEECDQHMKIIMKT
jgi:hypothetical protein